MGENKQKVSRIPEGYPIDAPRMNSVLSDTPVAEATAEVRKINGMTVTTQKAGAPRYETEAERSARAKSTTEVPGKNSKKALTVRTF